ncbi:hypothetical protein DAEQUDRAFT_734204 [Daedalea quercina L-15889]|uniref:Distal membrane-arm assembly complex protein 1-like domain-containing protein n=1 Tax=Daedalea quercina L-15889 TaxID=1314783 RepID=A0A165KGM2_9APHY|nr:hypothetical protein DAEQUDRAFT_734204 [Daedalea quercina L-15889]
MQSTTVPEQTSHVASGSTPHADAQSQDCLACRVVGTAALAGLGIHALNQSRAHQPGSLMGKRIMGGLGMCFMIGSYLRWTK